MRFFAAVLVAVFFAAVLAGAVFFAGAALAAVFLLAALGAVLAGAVFFADVALVVLFVLGLAALLAAAVVAPFFEPPVARPTRDPADLNTEPTVGRRRADVFSAMDDPPVGLPCPSHDRQARRRTRPQAGATA
ncbi:hypothetical protein [Metallococcus carri]|uniref:hypothetical protein n=1 Tax=Metallococcus carri TaxID=1656884 RepID=UPI001F240108|nr:hypothetical protein [Metallococcus carri]